MNVIRAAAVQLSPVLYSREGTVERVVNKIEQLGRQIERTNEEVALRDCRRCDKRQAPE